MENSRALLWLVKHKEFDLKQALRRYLERVEEDARIVIVNPSSIKEDFGTLQVVYDKAVRVADAVFVSNLKDWDSTLAN